MIAEQHLQAQLSFSTLHIGLYPIGEDIAVLLYGGERPHIGCTVIAVPRPSLRGDGSTSCTSSVMNLTGHKDEALCRETAEALCRRYGTTVTCTGGFHTDQITQAQLSELRSALKHLLQKIQDA